MSPSNASNDPGTFGERAETAEKTVCRRYVRRLWALPGTRMGVSRMPSTSRQRLFLRWDYWWQAHLLDCLVDAQLRDPAPSRRTLVVKLVRGSLIRNGFTRTNNYYDDMAWWGLALQRANQVFGLSADVGPILRACEAAIGPEGVVPWRRGDNFFNTPANGPVAIMLARDGQIPRASRMNEWLRANLLLDDGLLADGRVGTPSDGRLVTDRWTYTQGVGMAAELVAGDENSPHRIAGLVDAVFTQLARDEVLHGAGGGDGGLFAGILARYLALVAVDLDGDGPDIARTKRRAAGLVRTSAEAAWHNADHTSGTPVFGPDWSQPAGELRAAPGPVEDLSVQLSGWMVLEAAAMLDSRSVPRERL